MKKYKYNINNLDCSECARKIEVELGKNKKLKNVIVNFSTSKISYETDENISLRQLNSLIKKIEPEASVTTLEVKQHSEYSLLILLIGTIIGIIANFLSFSNIIKTILFMISYTLLLYRTTFNAIKLLINSRTINENALITISCIGAFVIGEPLEGMMVIVLYTIGKILEAKAINNSRRSIKSLINIKQNYANRKEGNDVNRVEVEKIQVNDILVVKKGERVPVDGIIIKGRTLLDTSTLTGESNPICNNEGDIVLSGSINVGDIIEIEATNIFENSTVSKILELLEDATDKKTKTETAVAKITKFYTPIIIFLSLIVIIFLPILVNISFKESLYRGLTLLVISCPCAIAISIPLSYFTAIGVSSKKGILIKGSNYLDNLSNAKNIIFDKTGTLTNGSFNVTNIELFDKQYTRDEVIDILRKGESFSNHPIAKSIMQLKGDSVDNTEVKNFREISGSGITYIIDDKQIAVGNKKLCNCDIDTTLHLHIAGKHVASINIDDGIKVGAKETIEKLKKDGIKTYMFTGDKQEVALDIGKKLNIDEIKYEMLPADKFDNFELIANNSGLTIFVGDGINDAPVLKRSDIGISMGGVGSELAIEVSDIVLMKDDLTRIPQTIDISRYTKKIIKQNLFFAIGIKLLILIFNLFGLANMWLAVFADTGVTLITILNTLRIIKKFKN